jgi:hypothetical protein
MHGQLAKLVSNRFSKLSDELSAKHAAKKQAQRNDFARRGLLDGPALQAAEMQLYLEHATELCVGRATIWGDTITASEGRFTREDAAFVESDLEPMIRAQHEHARRTAEESRDGPSLSSHFVQLIALWNGGLRGSIHRELEIRADQSVLDEKAEARRQAAADLAAAPRYVRALLGRWAKHRWVMDICAGIVLAFAVVGAINAFLEMVSAIIGLRHR